jgi:hypothetical protein
MAMSMTLGTGFFGGSSVDDNVQPRHLVQWTRVAYNADPEETFADFSGIVPWEAVRGSVPPYPFASNLDDRGEPTRQAVPVVRQLAPAGGRDALREEVRRIVLEELAAMVKG